MSTESTAAVDRIGPRSARPFGERLQTVGQLLAEVGLPFILVVYLALKGGGYDEVVYGEVGFAIWWIVLLGAAIGVLPRARLGAGAWACLGLLAAFACWTALGITWSASAEQSSIELLRVATYLGVFALALAAQRPGSLRRTLGAVTAGITLIGLLALLQRLHPSWFPANGAAHLIPASRARLNYPLNYWNGLAALLAVGIPLLLVAAQRARTLLGQALAAAAVPALALATYYTLSRGGAVEVAVGLTVLVALHPRRLALLPVFTVSAAGSAILIVAAAQRDALQNGIVSATAHSQANEMLAMSIVVCAGAGLIAVAIALAARHGLGPRPEISRRAARRTALGVLAALLVALVVGLASGLPGHVSDQWQNFKDPFGTSGASTSRFDSASGNGRYQYWSAALDANSTDPLIGIGPGTYQYWWTQHGSLPGPVLDAHSLYLQSLAETGIVGFVLIVGLVGGVLFLAVRYTLRAGVDRDRLAAATAACAVFAAAAAIDWVWQLAVLPAAFFLIAAAILGGRRQRDAAETTGGLRVLPRAAAVLASAGAIAVILLPLAAAVTLDRSRDQVDAKDLSGALASADEAHSIQPYAAAPELQRALVLELQGRYPQAAVAAQAATEADATNWKTWQVLSRVQAEAGNADGSVAAYKRARSLNPRSALFNQ